MNDIGMAVIGLGGFGEKHVEIYSQMNGVNLLGVVSRTKDRAVEIASKYKVPHYYTDYREMLEDKRIQAVSITTADDEHVDPSIASVRSGKHVLVEKPIAMNLSEARLMVDEARRAQVIFMPGHVLRFDPRYAEMENVINKKQIGDLIQISAKRCAPKREGDIYGHRANPIFVVGVHEIDLLLWYVKADVEEVYSVSAQPFGRANPDTVLSLIKFKNGVIASLEASWILPNQIPYFTIRMDVVGAKGALAIDLSNTLMSLCTAEGYKYPDTVHWPVVHGRRVGDLEMELHHFVKCVSEGGNPLVTGEDAVKAIEVAIAINLSVQQKKPISLPLL